MTTFITDSHLQRYGENLLEHLIHLLTLLYHICEIFLIMNFGNEIMLTSDRLSYCVFESNWIDQPQATKKLLITFAELLKQPHEIVIGKLYPLTLETFRRVRVKKGSTNSVFIIGHFVTDFKCCLQHVQHSEKFKIE